jgi:hypothetical protein
LPDAETSAARRWPRLYTVYGSASLALEADDGEPFELQEFAGILQRMTADIAAELLNAEETYRLITEGPPYAPPGISTE